MTQREEESGGRTCSTIPLLLLPACSETLISRYTYMCTTETQTSLRTPGMQDGSRFRASRRQPQTAESVPNVTKNTPERRRPLLYMPTICASRFRHPRQQYIQSFPLSSPHPMHNNHAQRTTGPLPWQTERVGQLDSYKRCDTTCAEVAGEARNEASTSLHSTQSAPSPRAYCRVRGVQQQS